MLPGYALGFLLEGDVVHLDEYAANLGRLIANLHSLEFALRAYLSQLPDATPLGLPHGADIYDLPVGTEIPESDITNYAPLGKLIRQFNDELHKQGKPPLDERGIVSLRDALAHGRVSAAAEGGTMRLIKFGQPDSQRNVRVVFNELLTADWFQRRRTAVREALLRVCEELLEAVKISGLKS